jgi:hypothetical protein
LSFIADLCFLAGWLACICVHPPTTAAALLRPVRE